MRLSIITINYNNLEGLKRTYDSVVCQTFNDYEWIVIDGGSTDGSREFIEQHQDKFAYWCSELDKGIYNAMNKGTAKAKGEYLNFMNSGDTFLLDSILEEVFEQSYKEDILYGDWMQVYNNHRKLITYPKEANIWNLYCMTINQQAMFVRRTLLRKRGFDESFRIQGDRHRWILASLDGCSFRHIGIAVSCYYMDGISQQGIRLPEEENKIDNLIPPPLLVGLKKLYVYENAHYYIRLTELIHRGGMAAFVTNVFLKIMHILFTKRKNESLHYHPRL